MSPGNISTCPGHVPGTKSEESGFRTGTEPTEIEAFTPEVDRCNLERRRRSVHPQRVAPDSGEIVDFGLSNQDVGVLFAEVSAAAVLDNSSGSVTVLRIGAVGAGTYEVDFGRDVTLCTAVATIGPATASSATGEINVADRSGNPEAVFVDTNDSAGAAADRPFRLVVVC